MMGKFVKMRIITWSPPGRLLRMWRCTFIVFKVKADVKIDRLELNANFDFLPLILFYVGQYKPA